MSQDMLVWKDHTPEEQGEKGMIDAVGKQDPLPAVTAPPALRTQYAALCWRLHRGRPEILLITSRDTGRWVIPKGWPMAERSPSEAASREAWEEAGVEGRAAEAALGQFHYDKVLRRAPAHPCRVEVFALQVRALTDQYPEHGQRRRKWFSPEKAARKVAEPELRELILSFRPDAAVSASG